MWRLFFVRDSGCRMQDARGNFCRSDKRSAIRRFVIRRIKEKGKRIKVGRLEKASGLAPFFCSGFRIQDAGCKRKVESYKLKAGDWCRHVGCGLAGLIRPTVHYPFSIEPFALSSVPVFNGYLYPFSFFLYPLYSGRSDKRSASDVLEA